MMNVIKLVSNVVSQLFTLDGHSVGPVTRVAEQEQKISVPSNVLRESDANPQYDFKRKIIFFQLTFILVN